MEMTKGRLLRTTKKQLYERITELEKCLSELSEKSPTENGRSHKQLSVFTTDGKTFTFKNISRLVTNEYVVMFNYIAMSDSKSKEGKFFVGNLAGYSLTPY